MRSNARPATASRVRIASEKLVLPTYLVEAPEASPQFYDGRQSQHAQARFYPYPANDRLTAQRAEVAYTAIVLENEYVRAVVLPELGGRLFSATDKTNGYEFLYRQSVVKPANIGITGAWISGGIEWCFPHHHRASTFATIDHRCEEHADGSATVHVGEIELRHRMQWSVSVTLRPGSSALEVRVRLINRTALAHSALYWANAAVHVNPDYQFIFPGSCQVASFHCKDAFTHWPVSHERDFKGLDLRGVDLSWWRNHRGPGSYFMHGMTEGFHGGYDHGRGAGTIHVADHRIVNCAKVFTWGNCPEGELENGKLTDRDGHYAELMVGAASDDQPDYTWMDPQQHREFVHYWYPIRGIGLVRHANAAAALNLEPAGVGAVRIAVNATRAVPGAQVRLLAADGAVISADSVRLAPDAPFARTVDLPAGTPTDGLRLEVVDAAGEPVIAWTRPAPAPLPALPEPVTPPARPADMRSADELLHTALRLVQLHNPVLSPYPYLDEAIARDAGDQRAHALLGQLLLKRHLHAEAERHLRLAKQGEERRHTQPRTGETGYHLALALLGQGREAEAEALLHRAAWNAAWEGPARTALAGILARGGRTAEALEQLDAALAARGRSLPALELRAVLLRRAGCEAAWRETLSAIDRLAPLDAVAAWERRTADPQSLRALLRDDAQSHLELAAVLGEAGAWDEAAALLGAAWDDPRSALAGCPLVGYHLAHALDRGGDAGKAQAVRRRAGSLRPDLAFPHGEHSLAALRTALAAVPEDANAHELLGDLLYDHQPEAAMAAWRRSVELDPGRAMAWRNLAFGQRQAGELAAAAASLRRALALEPGHDLWWAELDAVLAQAGAAPADRLAALEGCPADSAARPSVLWRQALARLHGGDPAAALAILASTRFFTYESRRDKYQAWFAAQILIGDAHRDAGRHETAIAAYQAALAHPDNLEAGKQFHDDQHAHAWCKIGLASEALGDGTQAAEAFRRSVACRNPQPGTDLDFWQGLALRRLGQEALAGERFAGLIRAAAERFRDGRWYDFFAGYQEKDPVPAQQARVRLAEALGRLGLGDAAGAVALLAQAVSLDPCNLWAGVLRARIAAGKGV